MPLLYYLALSIYLYQLYYWFVDDLHINKQHNCNQKITYIGVVDTCLDYIA